MKKIEETRKPELLAPAGDLEKLKTAVRFGADAVYLAGERFGLRAGAKNFGMREMAEGIAFAHERRVKCYIAVNIFAHNSDFDGLSDYIGELYSLGADAVIVSDPGVFAVAREAAPKLDIHISTQANVTNLQAALFWQRQGAKRIVLARELSLAEIAEIKEGVGDSLVLEAFVHGAMCVSYSGRCLLSNYFVSRDANRGECAHSCRWRYSIVEESRPNKPMPVFEDERGAYIMNSKDICMVGKIPDLLRSGVASFKIEGRMKTPFYVANIVRAYRAAIDEFFESPGVYERNAEKYMEMIKSASYRDFGPGFYYGKPDEDSYVYGSNSYTRARDFVAVVLAYDAESGVATIQQRNKFAAGDEVEFLRPGKGFRQKVERLWDEAGASVEAAPHAAQILKMRTAEEVAEGDIMMR